MDFSLAPPPIIREVWSEFVDRLKLGDPHTWIATVSDHALVAVAGQYLYRGSIAARSFALRQGVPKWALLVAPFTVAVKEPGVIHVLADLAFYKGHSAYLAFEDAQRRFREWIDKVDAESLRQTLGNEQYDLLTRGGTAQFLQAIFVMPPAWLSDP